MKFYAVRRGRTTGVFDSWDACRKQVFKFPGAEYKAFPTREEAVSFLSSAEKPLNKTQKHLNYRLILKLLFG